MYYRFVDFQRASEADWEARELQQKKAHLATRARRREEELKRAREWSDFKSSWLDAGCASELRTRATVAHSYENWRKNQLVKKRRLDCELRLQKFELHKKQAIEQRRFVDSVTDASEGIAWFETNLDRLGIAGKEGAVDLAAAVKIAASE